ncbi:ATP-dependent DNA helicase [Gracilibacillus boraciitolerans JCM 21714]|uniref:ATP-dependent DNA helicase n=1 Tax=Gracilibacillus boraciitolerans JCM 21714 TaxID=1298598 RepID=W4VHR6_9BACI|nr:ATP-dependent DNA helicase [Gracilibacillus boraciitolerans JCM 21714]
MNPISRFINEIPEELIEGKEELEEVMFGSQLDRIAIKDQELPFEKPKRKPERIVNQTTGGEKEAWQVGGDKATHKKWGQGTIVR